MALFIPRVLPEHANQNYIADVFGQQGIGWVHHVDLISVQRNGQQFFQAFVHFVYWYGTWNAYALQAQVQDPQIQARLHLGGSEGQRPSFWILSECRNPLTPAVRELRTQLFDERAQADWEILELRDLVARQDALLSQLLDVADDFSIEDFDPLLFTPEDISELPTVGAELAATQPDGFMRDFYMESHQEAFSPEWCSLSEEEKRTRLDLELDVYFLSE